MNPNKTAYLFLLLTTLFWGGNAIAGKLAIGHVSPMVLTSLRWLLAFLVFMMIGWAQFWREREVVKANLPLLIAFGALGFAIFNVALYSALNHTSAINVAIEQAGAPAAIFIGSYLLFRQRVTGLQVLGFGLSLVGVAVVASNGSLQKLATLEINRGDAFMLVAIITYSAYSVLLRYKPPLHWRSMMVVMSLSAFFVSLPFSWWEAHSGNAIWPDQKGMVIILYTALFPAAISQVLWIKGVDLIGANRAGIFINLVPIIGTLLAIILLGETFAGYHALALTLVVGGICIAEISGRNQMKSKKN